MNITPPKLNGKVSAEVLACCHAKNEELHELWCSTFIKEITVFACTCGRTYPDKKSAIICLNNDNLGDRTMSQPPGKTRATPTRAKKRPTTTAAKKRKKATKKA